MLQKYYFFGLFIHFFQKNAIVALFQKKDPDTHSILKYLIALN